MLAVKVCGVTSVGDAVMAVAAGATAIGLNFYQRSPRYVDRETAAAIVAALPPTVWRVGVFVDAAAAHVRTLADHLRLDTLQFHGSESPAYCRGWPQRVIKAVRLRHAQSLAEAAAYPVDFILVDAYVEGLAGGTGRTVRWEWVTGIDRQRLFLAGGLTADNVADAVRCVRPAGVDVASGVERAPGQKDAERVRRFVTNAQNA